MSQRLPPSVVVIGGGLAGIAASVQLAGAGVSVTIVETRKQLGGRATSFIDPDSGELLDNCQHVLLGCCTNLIDLYERLGVADRIQWHPQLYFCAAGEHASNEQAIDVLEADDLPAPLHLTRALMAFKTLGLAEKLAITRGMLAIIRFGKCRSKLHGQSFFDWLTGLRQPAGAIRKFWAPIITSACNELPQRVAADYAIQVFQEGFLAREDAYVMGVPAVPLVKLYETAGQAIQEAGGRVMLSCRADALVYEAEHVTGLRVAHEGTIIADAFISTVPCDRLRRLCPPAMLQVDGRLRRLDQIEFSPIIGVHLWYATTSDRPVMTLPHLVILDSPLHWIFNKATNHDDLNAGQHLHGVISAAHDLVNVPSDAIMAMVDQEVRKAVPAARDRELLRARVVKERRATFSAVPGVEDLRPPAIGAIPNLYLAGDWTRSGWPATMEGAVRSGYLAANAVLKDQRRSTESLSSLDAAPLYAWLTS